MLDAAELSRRRKLQHRAYARGGGLSEAEAAELQDLDTRVRDDASTGSAAHYRRVSEAEPNAASPAGRVPEPVEGPRVAPRDASLPTHHSTGRSASVGASGASGPGSAPQASGASGEWAPDGIPGISSGWGPDGIPGTSGGWAPEPVEGSPRPRRRIPLIPVLAVVALVVGVVVGSFLFGRLGGPTMTADQQNAWAKLEASGRYDPGSIHLFGSKYGTAIWSATMDKGDRPCVILTRHGKVDSDLSGAGCAMTMNSDQEMPVQGTLTYTEKGVDYVMWATLTGDIVGDPLMMVQRQRANEPWNWRMQYTDPGELKQAETLVAAGFDGQMISILGYDSDRAVWMGNDPAEMKPCLMVVQDGGAVAKQCDSDSEPIVLTVGDTTYGVLSSDHGSSALSITRVPAGAQ